MIFQQLKILGSWLIVFNYWIEFNSSRYGFISWRNSLKFSTCFFLISSSLGNIWVILECIFLTSLLIISVKDNCLTLIVKKVALNVHRRNNMSWHKLWRIHYFSISIPGWHKRGLVWLIISPARRCCESIARGCWFRLSKWINIFW